MKTDEKIHLLDELQSLLEEQMDMARSSDLRGVEELAEQTTSIIEKIKKTDTFDQPEFDSQRKHIVKLYKKLQLILAAGKDAVGKELKQAGNVRKTLNAYRHNG